MHLSPKSAENLCQLQKFASSCKKNAEFTWFCNKFSDRSVCRIAKSWRDCLVTFVKNVMSDLLSHRLQSPSRAPPTVLRSNPRQHRVHSIQDYLYSAFYDTIVAKQLYRKLRFYNIFIYSRNLIYLTYGKTWLIQYTVWGLDSSEVLWGVGIISSRVFGHLRSFRGWIQTEACVIPSYIPWQK